MTRYARDNTITIHTVTVVRRFPRSRHVGQLRPSVHSGGGELLKKKGGKKGISYSSHTRERSTRFAGTRPVDPVKSLLTTVNLLKKMRGNYGQHQIRIPALRAEIQSLTGIVPAGFGGDACDGPSFYSIFLASTAQYSILLYHCMCVMTIASDWYPRRAVLIDPASLSAPALGVPHNRPS